MNILLPLIGLFLVFHLLAKICDQYFIRSLDHIAKRLRMSEDVAGATLMAIGSSAPELFTSLIALTKVGSENIGAGTIVGSAIFNVLVIVGASAFVGKALLQWRVVVRDMGFYALAILVLLFTFRDGRITLEDALIYLGGYLLYIFILSRWRMWFGDGRTEHQLEDVAEHLETTERREHGSKGLWGTYASTLDDGLRLIFPKQRTSRSHIWTFTLSIALIIALSWALVELAVHLADSLGIPSVIVALTVLAAGTSIPDLLSSIVVAKEGRPDMAVSNAVGSNTFDILIGLGLPWTIYILIKHTPVTVATENLVSSIFLLFFTVLSMLFLLIFQRFHLGRKSGLLLLACYGGYLAYAVVQAYGVG